MNPVHQCKFSIHRTESSLLKIPEDRKKKCVQRKKPRILSNVPWIKVKISVNHSSKKSWITSRGRIKQSCKFHQSVMVEKKNTLILSIACRIKSQILSIAQEKKCEFHQSLVEKIVNFFERSRIFSIGHGEEKIANFVEQFQKLILNFINRGIKFQILSYVQKLILNFIIWLQNKIANFINLLWF